jgi:NADPH-dependent 2,4-dienoyl-CoA reductase/sulfur reductase-like enzyme
VHRVVVVGASLAAVHAVETLRANGFDGELTMVGAEPHLPYDRPPLSKEALRYGPDKESILLREPSWYEAMAVRLLLGRPARELDPGEKTVTLTDGTTLPYDGLVIATGSYARPVGHGTAPIHVLRTVDDAVRLREALDGASRLAILGAGFIGLEVAATAREMGLEVTVVEVAPVPLSRVLGDEVGQWFLDYHTRHGVDVRCGQPLSSVESDANGVRLRFADSSEVRAEVLLAGIGAAPATEWLRGSGLAVSDGIVCDPTLRTSAPGVVAAGDVARWYNPLFDQEMRVEQWMNAVEQGRHAALSLLGATDAYAPVPYLWSDQFDAKMRFVGTAQAAHQVHVEQRGPDSMVALFGRGGVLVGALCVNATRELPIHRKAIAERAAWDDVVG